MKSTLALVFVLSTLALGKASNGEGERELKKVSCPSGYSCKVPAAGASKSCSDPLNYAIWCNKTPSKKGKCAPGPTGKDVCDNPKAICCTCQTTGGNDPYMVGLQGQDFLFDGEDDKWYSLLHDPEGFNVNMHLYQPQIGGKTTYIDGVGLTLKGGDDEEHKIFVGVKDTKEFKPKCEEKDGLCVSDGAIQIVVDGKEITKPGFVDIDDDISFAAFNAPFECKHVPLSHKNWDAVEQMQHEKLQAVAMHHARHLITFDPTNDFMGYLDNEDVFDHEKCSEWVKARQDKLDLYEQKGQLASLFLTTPDFAVRIEFVVDDGSKWEQHQRFDITLMGYTPSRDKDNRPLTSGVLGETATLKIDEVLGTPIASGRSAVLAGADSDYEVKGPFSSDFKAKSFSKLRRFF